MLYFKNGVINEVIDILLKDNGTGKNIVLASESYLLCDFRLQITVDMLNNIEIQPRYKRSKSEQNLRTRKKAEVFTPTWICNMMNNFCDSEWFGREDVFNQIDSENKWNSVCDRIVFPDGKSWQEYVDSRRLEITCGEAPYLVSRYDTTTGELIPIQNRIGMLDRKMRIVGENTDTEEEWFKWAVRAFQSIYGYEFQGDNLLIARINLLLTFCDYLASQWNREATKPEVQKIANIISWNIWQMDGLTYKISTTDIDAKVMDWEIGEPVYFKDLLEEDDEIQTKGEAACMDCGSNNVFIINVYITFCCRLPNEIAYMQHGRT